MHELSVSSAVLDTALRHARGRRVSLVTLRVGHLRQVIPDSLEFYWGIVTRDTLCEGATLEQQVIPGRLRCDACSEEWDVEQPVFRCGACGGTQVTIAAGNELEVESIEVEEETACIG